MNPHEIKTTVRLSESDVSEALRRSKSDVNEAPTLDNYAEAAANIIKGSEQFKAVRAAAKPAEALSDALVREHVQLVDLVWAFDAKDKDKSSLIGGSYLLGYSISTPGKKLSFSNIGFYYDPDHESLDSLRRTVKDLKYAYALKNKIIKTSEDDFPVPALTLDEVLDPNVREKVSEADMITVINLQDNHDCHFFTTKVAMECRAKGNTSKLKFMVFCFDPKIDSIQEFAAALKKITGKNWSATRKRPPWN